MTYLDLTADESRRLHTEGVVELWVPIQADGFDIQQLSDGTLEAHYPNDRFAAIPAPHSPGTRARVNTGAPTQAGGVTVRVGAIVIAVCKSVTPEHRDGWGFVERWEKC